MVEMNFCFQKIWSRRDFTRSCDGSRAIFLLTGLNIMKNNDAKQYLIRASNYQYIYDQNKAITRYNRIQQRKEELGIIRGKAM